MERIILVCGGDKKVIENYASRSLAHTGTLLLRIFDESISAALKAFSSEYDSENVTASWGQLTSKCPLWWRLRNFRGALLRQVKLLHEIRYTGARFL